MGCENEDIDCFVLFSSLFLTQDSLTVCLLPLLLFQRWNKFDPHLHSKLFTDKTEQKKKKKKQEEQA